MKGLTHSCKNGARMVGKVFDEEESKVEVSITTKAGKRALYYNIDMTLGWVGFSAPVPGQNDKKCVGMIRIWNIAHDTKLRGEDDNTGYSYEVLMDSRTAEPWSQELVDEG